MRWINSFDQYKKGADQQMYLELWNGNELTVRRVTKEPIRIPQSNVNVLGGMQPKIVKQLANNNRSDDGFLDRFLFVYPDNIEPSLFTGLKIPEVDQRNYTKLINNLLDAPAQVLTASTSNSEIYKKWQHQKAKEYFNDSLERSIQAKMQTYVWRLTLIIEMMQQATTGEFNAIIQNESLDKAISLVEYFRLNSFKVHDKILTKNPLIDLSVNQQELYKQLPQEFKRSEVLTLFENHEIRGGSIARYLNKTELFKNVKHGFYKKLF